MQAGALRRRRPRAAQGGGPNNLLHCGRFEHATLRRDPLTTDAISPGSLKNGGDNVDRKAQTQSLKAKWELRELPDRVRQVCARKAQRTPLALRNLGRQPLHMRTPGCCLEVHALNLSRSERCSTKDARKKKRTNTKQTFLQRHKKQPHLSRAALSWYLRATC